MGRVASSVDNGLMESFWSTMQHELLDRQRWATRADLGSAIFEWIEAFYNPRRRHSALGYLSPCSGEIHTTALTAACSPHPTCPGNPVRLQASELPSPGRAGR